MGCMVLCLLFLSVWFYLRSLMFCADKFYYMPVVCVCGRVIMLWFILEALMLKQHMKGKLFNKILKYSSNAFASESRKGTFKQVYSSTYCTAVWPKHVCHKNTVKRLHVHGIEGFTSSRTEIFYHLFIKTSFIPPMEWDETQTSIFLRLSAMKSLACKTPLTPMRSKHHICMIFNHFEGSEIFLKGF